MMRFDVLTVPNLFGLQQEIVGKSYLILKPLTLRELFRRDYSMEIKENSVLGIGNTFTKKVMLVELILAFAYYSMIIEKSS